MKPKSLVRTSAAFGILLLAGAVLTSCTELPSEPTSTSAPVETTAPPTLQNRLCDTATVPDAYKDDVNDAAKKSGLQPSIIAAIIHTQSDWEIMAAVPSGNARGLALLTPGVWEKYGEGNIFNGHDNIAALGGYLEHVADTVKGKNGIGADYTDLVIAALVTGERAVVNAGEIPATPGALRYVELVNKYADRYKNCSKDV